MTQNRARNFALIALAFVLIGGPVLTLLPESQPRTIDMNVLTSVDDFDIRDRDHRAQVVMKEMDGPSRNSVYKMGESDVSCRSNGQVHDLNGREAVSVQEMQEAREACRAVGSHYAMSVTEGSGSVETAEMNFPEGLVSVNGKPVCRIFFGWAHPVEGVSLETFRAHSNACNAAARSMR